MNHDLAAIEKFLNTDPLGYDDFDGSESDHLAVSNLLALMRRLVGPDRGVGITDDGYAARLEGTKTGAILAELLITRDTIVGRYLGVTG
jgi:hypothetical protein